MDAETIAKGLSAAQKNAIIRIGEDDEKGAWTGSAGINWISVALMMRKYGTNAILEGVPDAANHCRLNPTGRAVREILLRDQ